MFLTLPWQLNDTLICYSKCAYLYTQTWFFVPPIAFYIAEIFPTNVSSLHFSLRLLSGRLTKGHRSQGNKTQASLHTWGRKAAEPPALQGEGRILPDLSRGKWAREGEGGCSHSVASKPERLLNEWFLSPPLQELSFIISAPQSERLRHRWVCTAVAEAWVGVDTLWKR